MTATVATGLRCGVPGTRDMPPLSAFDDILILPFTQLLEAWKPGGATHCGGPLWPDWDRQIAVRHCRRGRPVDVPPVPLPAVETFPEPVAWGGAIVRHFGHQIAEFSMRLLPTLREWPGAVFAFAVKPEFGIVSLDAVPPFFSEVLAWFGTSPDRIRIVSRPTLASRLVVAPQAEQFGPFHGEIGPAADHRDAVDELVGRRLAAVTRRGTVYVSRAGQRWHFAGEAALERALARAGVEVFRPEEHPLAEQLRTYAGAERLLFAEGSAVHSLQLLGRGLGDVAVILRRPGAAMARPSLEPRVRNLAYLDFGVRFAHGLEPTGAVAKNAALSVLDETLLVAGLERLGISVAPHWDTRHWRETSELDARQWLVLACEPRRLSIPGAAEAIRTSLATCGFGHLAPVVDDAVSRMDR